MGLGSYLGDQLERWAASRGFVKAEQVKYSYSTSLLLGAEAAYAGAKEYSMEEWLANQDQDRLERLSLVVSWVGADIFAICNTASLAQLNVKETTQEEKTTDIMEHPFELMMASPSEIPFIDTSFLLGYSTMWYLLRGEAYWWTTPNVEGDLMSGVKEIMPIPSNRMEPEPHDSKMIKRFLYTSEDGDKIPIPAENVLYWRYPNPFDFHRGLSRISSYRLAMETDWKASRWNENTFDKGLALSTLLLLPALSDMPEPDYQTAKADLTRELAEEKRRYAIARTGQLDVKTFGMSKAEAEFLSGREMSRREIDRVFGIPEGFFSEKANRANAEAARSTFIEMAVWPHLVSLQRAITSQILHRYYGSQYLAEFTDMRPRNIEQEMAESRHKWTTMTYDEVRESRGGLAHPDGDVGQAPYPAAPQAYLVKLQAKLQSMMAPPEQPGATTQLAEAKALFIENADFLDGQFVLKTEATVRVATRMARLDMIKDELRKWRKVATKAINQGWESDTWEFKVNYIPPELENELRLGLGRVKTVEQVDRVFDSPEVDRYLYSWMLAAMFSAMKAEVDPKPFMPRGKRPGLVIDPLQLLGQDDFIGEEMAIWNQYWSGREGMEDLVDLTDADVTARVAFDDVDY